MTTATDILTGLQCEKTSCACHASARKGKGLTHCPAHDDPGPSLGVKDAERTPNPLVRCFAGCSYDAITTALLERNLWPEKTAYAIGTYVHRREELPNGRKRMEWTRGARPKEVLYGNTCLEPGSGVLLVEGEKACDAATALGYNAVATVCGASALPEMSALLPLKELDVILCPDNDGPGRAHMTGIAQMLSTIDVRARWLVIPGLPEKGDIADYTGPADALEELVNNAPEWTEVGQPQEWIDWSTFWTIDPRVEDWLIEPIIPRGRAIALYSPAKQGKSLFALDVVVKAATGQRVLDRPAGNPLTVVYFDLEMTEDDLYERLEDMGYGPGTDLSRLFYYLLPSLPPLDTPEGGRRVLEIARLHDADIVVIDTTSRVLSGPENEADTLRAFYIYTGLPLKADGRTVLRLDHAGKLLERGQRGTSAKNDDVDLVWELKADDEDGVTLRATHRRQSWIPEIVPMVRLEEPLRHERAAYTFPAGTEALVKLLEQMEVPIDFGARKVRSLLRERGQKYRNNTIGAAIRFRKSTAGTHAGTHEDKNEWD